MVSLNGEVASVVTGGLESGGRGVGCLRNCLDPDPVSEPRWPGADLDHNLCLSHWPQAV